MLGMVVGMKGDEEMQDGEVQSGEDAGDEVQGGVNDGVLGAGHGGGGDEMQGGDGILGAGHGGGERDRENAFRSSMAVHLEQNKYRSAVRKDFVLKIFTQDNDNETSGVMGIVEMFEQITRAEVIIKEAEETELCGLEMEKRK